MKRLAAIILVVTLVVVSMSFTAYAADEYVFTYTVSDSEATITGVSEIPAEAEVITIPSYVSDGTDEYKVTAIKADAFSGNTSLKGELVLPATLKTVGNNAFKGCTGITAVTVEEGTGVKLGTAVFQGSNAIKYVKFPKGTDITGANNIFNGAIKSAGSLIELEEGLTTMPYQAFRQSDGLVSLVMPSTMTDIRLAAFFVNQYLEELYVLAENVNFLSTDSFDATVNSSTSVGLNPVTGTKGMGSLTTDGSTKIYVVNKDVKQAFLDKGWPLESRIEVMAHKTAFFYDSYNQPLKVEDEDDDGFVTLPEPRGRDGYKFLYWNIGGAKYFPGENYNLTKSIAVTGKWVKDTEAETVLYKNISSNKQINEFENAQVGRIICAELANKEVKISLTDENDNTIEKAAIFDSNGKWINFDDTTLYKKTVMPSGYDYSKLYILVNAENNFKADIELREPQIIAMPKIDGVDNLSEMTWTSSNPTVISVADGIVTGLASGTATITVTYGETLYSFDAEAFGEMAICIKNGQESEYLEDKKAVFSTINTAIKNEDAEALKKVFTSTDNASLSYIKDFDTAILPTDETSLTALAERIITYGEFDFSTTDNVSDFIKILTTEIVVGEINSLTDVVEVETVLTENNTYYNLPLENEYYLKHKEDVLAKFVEYTAENAEGLRDDFKEAYVMTAVEKAVFDSGYAVLRAVVDGCSAEIGYIKSHYDVINTAAFHKQLLKDIKNGKVETLSELKDYIDTSDGVESSGGSGGGGGGSSGGSGVIVTPSNPSVSDTTFVTGNDYEQIVSESNLPQDTSSVFTDMETDRWSYDEVQYLVAKKIISGYEDGSFKPQNKITRAEFIKMISSTFDFEYTAAEGENTFADISGYDWYYGDVITAYNNKIVYGDEYGKFNPNEQITRQEMAAILYRAIVAKGVEIDTVESVNIADKNSIADWAYTSVFRLVGMDIINGCEDGTFKPENKATREEVAKLIYGVALKLSGEGAK